MIKRENVAYNNVWFKEHIAPQMSTFDIQYRYFSQGDFGSLDEVNFESERFIGTINYWGNGFLSVTLFDNIMNDIVVNIMVDSDIENDKLAAMNDLLDHIL